MCDTHSLIFFGGQHPTIVIIDDVLIQEKRIQAPSAFAGSIFWGLRQNRTVEEAIFVHFHFLIIYGGRLLVACCCAALHRAVVLADNPHDELSAKKKPLLSI